MLRIKGLVKRYRTGDLALKGIDLEVPDGQVMALIGPSGAGKSTVIRCINRLAEPTTGTVTLNNTESTPLGRSHPRRARAHHAGRQRAAPGAAAHGHDLPGVRAGRTPERDGKRAERTPGLRRLLAKLVPEIPAVRHRRGVPAVGARRPRPHGRQARR